MIKRTIEISSDDVRLSLRHKQLVIQRNGELAGTVPFEDLGVLVVDSRRATVTTAALAAAVNAGSAVLVCGPNHHPVGMLMPVTGNSLLTLRFRHQLAASGPLGKRLWAEIVKGKIRCQAALLQPGSDARVRLETLVAKVRSGDPENVESQAARAYWPVAMPPVHDGREEQPFRRQREGLPPNNLLNYGYMVLRAAVCRAVCAAGLQAALGLHHDNRNNPFCLADDLMEPYRPWVDARVRRLAEAEQFELVPEVKREILEVLTDPVLVGGERGPLLVAVQRTVNSLCRCFARAYSRRERRERTVPAEIVETLELPAFVAQGVAEAPVGSGDDEGP